MASKGLLRKKQPTVDLYFKLSAFGRHQNHSFDLWLELLEQFSRQTGGAIGVVSDCTIGDGDIQQHASLQLVWEVAFPIITHPQSAFWYNAFMSPALFPRGVPPEKRLFDLLITLVGGILIAPILGITALVLWLTEGRPILFSQARAGLNNKIFYIYKFRTMRETFDDQGRPLPDDKRLSRVGKFLRATSLDELPEIVNVLRGEMSLVGPRPLLARYLERYSPEQARRHEALPGITGWAQINGRNAITWEERFAMDVWYVDHWSLWLDIRILAMTLMKVIRREGISEPGHVTMTEFMGSSADPASAGPAAGHSSGSVNG